MTNPTTGFSRPSDIAGDIAVDQQAVDRVREVQDTTSVAGTDAEIAVPTDVTGDAGERYLIRSEEQLQVGTERVAAERVRLEKFVVTEEQTVTVSVSHDEVRIVREPIADGTPVDDGAAVDDRAVDNRAVAQATPDMILTEERIVVTKVVVPVERVRLTTETVTEQRQVTESVRKEQIELSDDGIGRATKDA